MLAFLFDENMPRKVVDAVRRHNLSGSIYPLDVLAVGESGAPTLGTPDSDILKWIEVESRLLVTRDISSLPNHLADHLSVGGTVPGILEVRIGATIPAILAALQLIAHVGHASDFANQIQYIP